MKMKSVLAAAAALAGLSCVSVCAFADTADGAAAQNEVQTPEDEETAVLAAAAADPIEGNNPDTGVGVIASGMGVVAIAGAILAISHKQHDN